MPSAHGRVGEGVMFWGCPSAAFVRSFVRSFVGTDIVIMIFREWLDQSP